MFRDFNDGDIEDEIREALRMFDKEGNGFISATAIQMIFKSLGVPVQKAVLGE